jgi:hypothetical protein
VYGNSSNAVDETVPPTQKLLPPKVQFEEEVVTNQDVEGVVIRPPFVYGGKGGNKEIPDLNTDELKVFSLPFFILIMKEETCCTWRP